MTQHPEDLGDNTVVYLPSLYRRDFTAAVQSAPIRPQAKRRLSASAGASVLLWLLIALAAAYLATATWQIAAQAHASAVAQGALMMEGGL